MALHGARLLFDAGSHTQSPAVSGFVSAETAGGEWMGTADCSEIGKAGLAKGNSVQSIFLKETRGKETIACRGSGQQVA